MNKTKELRNRVGQIWQAEYGDIFLVVGSFCPNNNGYDAIYIGGLDDAYIGKRTFVFEDSMCLWERREEKGYWCRVV